MFSSNQYVIEKEGEYFTLSKNEAIILFHIGSFGVRRYKDIAEMANLSLSSVHNAIKRLEKKGLVTTKKVGKYKEAALVYDGFEEEVLRVAKNRRKEIFPSKLSVAMTMRNLSTAQVARICKVPRSVITNIMTNQEKAFPPVDAKLEALFNCAVGESDYPLEILNASSDVQVATINAVLRHIVVNWDKWFRIAGKKILAKKYGED